MSTIDRESTSPLLASLFADALALPSGPEVRLPSPSAGRRVDRAFAFVDLSGFTALTNHEGDDRAVAELSVFRWALREIAGKYGVRVAKWLGDGAMLVGVQPVELVEAVIDLVMHIQEHQLSLPLRGGLAGGPTLLFEGDDYIGSAVNLAARLCDEADDHQLLATTEIASLLGATDSQATPMRIRGFDEVIDVVDLSPQFGPGR